MAAISVDIRLLFQSFFDKFTLISQNSETDSETMLSKHPEDSSEKIAVYRETDV